LSIFTDFLNIWLKEMGNLFADIQYNSQATYNELQKFNFQKRKHLKEYNNE